MPRMPDAPVPPLCVSLAPPKQKFIHIGGFTSEKTEGSFMFPSFLLSYIKQNTKKQHCQQM